MQDMVRLLRGAQAPVIAVVWLELASLHTTFHCFVMMLLEVFE